MSLLDDIATRLSAQSVGTTGATSSGWLLVGRGWSPSTANQQQIMVRMTGGLTQEQDEIDRRTFQVMVRASATASTGLETKVDAVDSALNLYAGTLNERKYVLIQRQGDRIDVGRDANQRPMYSLNYLAFYSQTT